MRHKLIAMRGKMSVTRAAQHFGITRQMLGYIERGERTPSLILAKRIADFYGSTIDELFFDQKGNETFLDGKTA